MSNLPVEGSRLSLGKTDRFAHNDMAALSRRLCQIPHDAGKLIGTDDESAWRAGANGAVPGIQMPSDPQLDVAVYQEHAPVEEAMDYAMFVELDATVTTPAGTFEHVYKAFESSTAEPESPP